MRGCDPHNPSCSAAYLHPPRPTLAPVLTGSLGGERAPGRAVRNGQARVGVCVRGTALWLCVSLTASHSALPRLPHGGIKKNMTEPHARPHHHHPTIATITTHPSSQRCSPGPPSHISVLSQSPAVPLTAPPRSAGPRAQSATPPRRKPC